MKIGAHKEYLNNVDSDVKKVLEESISEFENQGAILEELNLPLTDYCMDIYYIIAPSEASSNLSRYDGVKYGFRGDNKDNSRASLIQSRSLGFGDEVKRRIMIGTYTLSAGYYDAYYKKAQQIRTLVVKEFDEAFKQYDVLLAPTSPTTAFDIGEKTDDPIKMYQSDLCTIPVNIAGLPAISLTGGFSNNMPVGIQIIGPQNGDPKVIQFAHKFQENTKWHLKFPKI